MENISQWLASADRRRGFIALRFSTTRCACALWSKPKRLGFSPTGYRPSVSKKPQLMASGSCFSCLCCHSLQPLDGSSGFSDPVIALPLVAFIAALGSGKRLGALMHRQNPNPPPANSQEQKPGTVWPWHHYKGSRHGTLTSDYLPKELGLLLGELVVPRMLLIGIAPRLIFVLTRSL